VVADLYGIVNVPTVVWIDENGRIARPNTVAFGTDIFKDLTGMEAQPHLDAVRAWVRSGVAPLSEEEIRNQQMLPSAEEQLAKTEFALGWYLARRGRPEAARRHFARGGELAPDDFTVRRACMPILGIDPMSSTEFFELYQEWTARGRPYYRPRPDDSAHDDSPKLPAR
jgi:hypothetical protein